MPMLKTCVILSYVNFWIKIMLSYFSVLQSNFTKKIIDTYCIYKMKYFLIGSLETSFLCLSSSKLWLIFLFQIFKKIYAGIFFISGLLGPLNFEVVGVQPHLSYCYTCDCDAGRVGWQQCALVNPYQVSCCWLFLSLPMILIWISTDTLFITSPW